MGNWEKLNEIKSIELQVEKDRDNLSTNYDDFIRERETLSVKKYKLEAARVRLKASIYRKNRQNTDNFIINII